MVYNSRGRLQASAANTKAQIVHAEDFRRLGEVLGCRTQHDFAQRLGISQARVSQILSGAHPLRPGALLTLVRSLLTEHGVAPPRRKGKR